MRSGDARPIFRSISFQNAAGNDISDRIGITESNGPGVFATSTTFAAQVPFPDDLGNDARSVQKVVVGYRLPWEQNDRSITGT